MTGRSPNFSAIMLAFLKSSLRLMNSGMKSSLKAFLNVFFSSWKARTEPGPLAESLEEAEEAEEAEVRMEDPDPNQLSVEVALLDSLGLGKSTSSGIVKWVNDVCGTSLPEEVHVIRAHKGLLLVYEVDHLFGMKYKLRLWRVDVEDTECILLFEESVLLTHTVHGRRGEMDDFTMRNDDLVPVIEFKVVGNKATMDPTVVSYVDRKWAEVLLLLKCSSNFVYNFVELTWMSTSSMRRTKEDKLWYRCPNKNCVMVSETSVPCPQCRETLVEADFICK